MSGNAKQKRRTAKRKAKQREESYVRALRKAAVMYEGVTGRNAARMSRERLEETVRRGKARRSLHPLGIGLPLALAAAASLKQGSRT